MIDPIRKLKEQLFEHVIEIETTDRKAEDLQYGGILMKDGRYAWIRLSFEEHK